MYGYFTAELLPQLAQKGNFFAPLVFLPLRRNFIGAEAAHLYLKTGKPQNSALNFVGVVTKEKPNKKRLCSGHDNNPGSLTLKPFAPAERGCPLFVFAHVVGKARQPCAVEQAF